MEREDAATSAPTEAAALLRAPDALPRGRLSAYWFWSGLPSEAVMQQQLQEFRDQGFGTIYIQARPSMPLPLYLSPDYLAAYARAVRIMAGLGLKAGLYDDYAWTSGQAGGRTVEGADHLRERHLFWAESAAASARISGIAATLGASLGPAVRDWIHEGGTPVFGDWTLIAAVLRHPDGSLVDVTAEVSLCDPQPDGVTARFKGDLPPGASWTFFASTRATNSRIINYLLPEAGARFVEKGLEPYAKALAGLMPDPVQSLFFDQPAPVLYRWNEATGNLLNSLLWSEEFSEAISARGPLGPQLAALLHGDGPGVAATRSFIYRTYTGMIQRAFFAPLRAFCDRHGLRLTGHEILPHVASFALNGGFSSIDPRVALAADFFGNDLWRDQTAVDVNNLDPQLAPMLGHSIARAAGRRGCLTELYVTALRTETRAAGQWEMTPAALRAQLIRLHLLGTSEVILHALYADEGDARPEPLANIRFDFAPGYNLQPWWPVMRALSAEVAKLADFIAGATPLRQVAVLYPYQTALVEGPRHAHAAAFGAWCEKLFDLGHLPLIIDEAGLARIETGAESARLYGSGIAALVLPGVTALADSDSAGRIEALGAAGVELWRDAPGADLPAWLAAHLGGPVVTPVPGLRAMVLGRDAAGWWRLVLFNDGEAEVEATVRLDPGFTCDQGQGESLAMRSLGLRLDPQELRCLRLREAAAAGLTDQALPPRPAVTTLPLDGEWTLRSHGAPRPIAVTEGWQAQGDAAWSGLGRYETGFTLELGGELVLDLPGLACAAFVSLDGKAQGQIYHPPWRLPLGRVAAGHHVLCIDVANTAANRYYAETPYAGAPWPDASGLTAAPRLLLIPS